MARVAEMTGQVGVDAPPVGGRNIGAILAKTARYDGGPECMATIMEHGRRNMALQSAGLLRVVCPVPGDERMAGIGIFAADPDQVHELMAGDPAVEAGLLAAAIYAARAFPGDLTAPRP